jgi:hypothetical protein
MIACYLTVRIAAVVMETLPLRFSNLRQHTTLVVWKFGYLNDSIPIAEFRRVK